VKTLLEEEEPAGVLERAAAAIPARLRPPAFAVTADLLLADGKIDARERRFLQRLATSLGLERTTADEVIEAMLVKNRL
jgi:hypothetical protein